MWHELRAGGLPDPMTYLPEPVAYDESQRRKREAWQAARERSGAEVDALVEALSRPDIRVILRAIDERDPANPARSIRVHAVRRGEDAFVVAQRPGADMESAGGFTVTRHEVLSLGDAVAAVLPDVEAGRRRDFELVDTDSGHDFTYGRSLVHDDGYGSPTSPNEFLAEPMDLSGTIAVEQGWSRFGPRGVLRLAMVWRDVIGDGRYAILPGSPLRVAPVDRRRLVGLINGQIAEVVRAIKDDRA